MMCCVLTEEGNIFNTMINFKNLGIQKNSLNSLKKKHKKYIPHIYSDHVNLMNCEFLFKFIERSKK